MYEFNIDNTGDNVEDPYSMSQKCKWQDEGVWPVAPCSTRSYQHSTYKYGPVTETVVTAYAATSISSGTNSNGTKVFAGPRMILSSSTYPVLKEIIAGTQTSFRSPGVSISLPVPM